MSSLRDSLLGTWRLLDIRVCREGETQEIVYPMAKDASGSIIYAPDGYMSVQIMVPGAKPFASGNQWTATTDELADAARHYMAYAGPFDVTDTDPAGPIVTHTMQVASVPNMVGNVERRIVSFEDRLEGRVLVLKAENQTLFLSTEAIFVLRWTQVAK